jgi:hypothetical protein
MGLKLWHVFCSRWQRSQAFWPGTRLHFSLTAWHLSHARIAGGLPIEDAQRCVVRGHGRMRARLLQGGRCYVCSQLGRNSGRMTNRPALPKLLSLGNPGKTAALHRWNKLRCVMRHWHAARDCDHHRTTLFLLYVYSECISACAIYSTPLSLSGGCAHSRAEPTPGFLSSRSYLQYPCLFCTLYLISMSSHVNT